MSNINIGPPADSTAAPPSATATATMPQQALQQPWAAAGPLQSENPAGIQSAGPLYSYGLMAAPGRVKGLLSDYRTGYVTFTEEAVYLQGQSVLPNRTRMWILVPLVLLSWPLAIIGSIVLEYVARRPQFSRLTWDTVREIVLEPKKGRVCLVYAETDKPKAIFSLAFKPGAYYDNFVEAARYFAPEKVREGKIGPVTSPWAYVAIVIIFGLSIAAVLFSSK